MQGVKEVVFHMAENTGYLKMAIASLVGNLCKSCKSRLAPHQSNPRCIMCGGKPRILLSFQLGMIMQSMLTCTFLLSRCRTHTRAHALILATQIDLEPLSFMYGGGIRWWQRVLKIYTGMFNEHTSVTTLLGSRSGDSGTCTDTPCSLIDTLFFVCVCVCV